MRFGKPSFEILKIFFMKKSAILLIVLFTTMLQAQEIKQIKGLDNLEKRLLKAEKRIHIDTLERILQLQNELFPNQSLQERKSNFSEFYLAIGNELIAKLIEELDPLKNHFSIITL